MMLRRAYDLDNKIYDTAYEKAHPYALIEAHSAETNAFNSLFHRYAERYERFGVESRFHLSLTEFMQYSPEDVEWMLSYCEHRQMEEKKAHDEANGKAKSIVTDKTQVASDFRSMMEQKGKV
ncbi:hypothetical protein NRE35_004360 [Salmonella enterica]|nr:hypothetical protein [Salmonella enterica]